MGRILRGLARVGLVAGLVLSTASMGRSAEYYNCGKCYNNEHGTAHVFWTQIYWYSYKLMDCDAYNTCHSDSQPGSCGEWHWGCGMGATLPYDLSRALARRDAEEIRKLLASNPAFVRYDAREQTVTLTDCRGAVVSRHPVSGALREALS